MAGRSIFGPTTWIAVVTCIATVCSVTWLSSLMAVQHGMGTTLNSSLTPSFPRQRLSDRESFKQGGIEVEVSERHDLSRAERGAAGFVKPRDRGSLPSKRRKSVSKVRLSTQKQPDQCQGMPNTDYWGDALLWGSKNHKATAQECCESCQNFKPEHDDQPGCNVWVYCGDKKACGANYQECWVKYLSHPEGSSPKTGPHVPWTSGVFGLPPAFKDDDFLQAEGEDRTYHVVVTAQGAATQWQTRIHYYWYKKIQKECQAKGVCHMGGWTRLLHSGQPDELMDEIPTHVVDPLIDKDNKGYVVLNRPWAFVQWLRDVKIKEKYIFMSEPDHIWLKPMPNLMFGNRPAAFPFFYIEPAKADYRHITEKFTGKLTRQQVESISPIGNAPTLLSYSDLKKVAETWMNTSHAIFDDEEAHKAWGWVLEMYGFAISCYRVGIEPATLYLKMMAQPPWDNDVPYGPSFYILHYTYGMDYTLEGKFSPGKIGAWRFDKRVYSQKPPPRRLQEPPPGMDNSLVRKLIDVINEATDAIPGWDQYSRTGVASKLWNGQV